MTSYSYTESATFTVTHARHMAAKISTDLKRIQRLYGKPSDKDIADYESEAVAMIKAGYLFGVLWLQAQRFLDRTNVNVYSSRSVRGLSQ
jgi:hypothetical protein